MLGTLEILSDLLKHTGNSSALSGCKVSLMWLLLVTENCFKTRVSSKKSSTEAYGRDSNSSARSWGTTTTLNEKSNNDWIYIMAFIHYFCIRLFFLCFILSYENEILLFVCTRYIFLSAHFLLLWKRNPTDCNATVCYYIIQMNSISALVISP